MTLGDMIAAYRREHGLSMDRFAELSGLSKGYISMLERNRTQRGDAPTPSIATFRSVAGAIGVTVDELIRKVDDAVPMGEAPEMVSTVPQQMVPVVGLSAAGLPVYAEQDIEGYIWTERNHGGTYFGVRIRGNSMNAAGIDDGDIVLIRKQDTVEDGEIALVLIDDGATIKRFHQEGDTVILTPQSTDPANQVQIYSLRDHTIRILGKAVENRKSF